MTNRRLRKYFEKRPSTDILYIVDGLVFTTPEKAQAYADSVKLKVEPVTRNEVEELLANGGEAKEIVEEQLREMELNEKSDYQVLKSMVETLELATGDNKKVSYLKALSDYKSEIEQ